MRQDAWDSAPFGVARADNVSMSAREILAHIVAEKSGELVSLFYATFLSDKEASTFLNHSIVHDRLSHSLQEWLAQLFAVDSPHDLDSFEDRQRAIGNVHARIKIPIHLVLEGASLIKGAIAAHILHYATSREVMGTALIMLDQRIDHAMRLMSQAYVSGTTQRAQMDEAFRLFTLGQDITLERERQRAALMEWSQTVLFALFGNEQTTKLKAISSSSFGLWLHHRANVMFQGVPAIETIEGAMQQIDGILLPKLEEIRASNRPVLTEPLAQLQSLMEEIKLLLADLFDSVEGLENGRDPLTRTLNRRFLPSILSREISIAGRSCAPLTILMIDIDHFKQINDRWGHPAGDLVLRDVAEVILNTVRLSDFVFRYGGEEFLVVLVETDAHQSLMIAERIRQELMGHDLRLPDGTEFTVTASIGLATYEGHPDHAYLVEAADRALYEAKRAGRNRTTVARSPESR